MGKAGVAMPYKVLLRDGSESVNSVFILFHLKFKAVVCCQGSISNNLDSLS